MNPATTITICTGTRCYGMEFQGYLAYCPNCGGCKVTWEVAKAPKTRSQSA